MTPETAITIAHVIAAIGVICWLWTLVEVLNKEKSQDATKLLWALVVIVGFVFGALVYLAYRRPRRIKELGE